MSEGACELRITEGGGQGVFAIRRFGGVRVIEFGGRAIAVAVAARDGAVKSPENR